MIAAASKRTQSGVASPRCGFIDNLPGQPRPARSVQVSVGLLTDGSTFFPAFPGEPSGMIEMNSPPTVAGAVSVHGQARGEFPVISLRKPTPRS